MTIKNLGLIVVAAVLAGCGGNGGDNGGGPAPVNQAPTVSGIADQVAVANRDQRGNLLYGQRRAGRHLDGGCHVRSANGRAR